MEHTPGPWEMRERSVWGNRAGGMINVIATCITEDRDGADHANARLIAAAPDLLECLKWYVENDDVNEGAPGNEFYTDGLNRARAAIEKATDGGK